MTNPRTTPDTPDLATLKYDITALNINKRVKIEITGPDDHFVRYTISLMGYPINHPDGNIDDVLLALAEVLVLPYQTHSDMSFGELFDVFDAADGELADIGAHLQEDQSHTNWMDLEAAVLDFVYLSRLVVSPLCRGQGIGSRMMQLLLQEISHQPYMVVSATPCELTPTTPGRDHDATPPPLLSVNDLSTLSFSSDDPVAQARLRDWYARFGFSLVNPLTQTALMATALE